MKKTIILCAAALLVAASAFTAIKVTRSNDSVIAENVDALACDPEITVGDLCMMKEPSICVWVFDVPPYKDKYEPGRKDY